ncbi:MAG TPA: acetyltransferase [Pyrinomonadaceae bacterium]|nr:acetyltransferase [Pyrinomonadaceae bacterium]
MSGQYKSPREAGKLVIVGIGETAELAYEYFKYDSPHEVVGFAVESAYKDRDEFFGLPVVAFEEIEKHFSPAEHLAFAAISYTQLNRVRARIFKTLKEKGYTCASYVSSRAFVWHNAEIGENCFIFENNVVQYKVKIGNNVVLWSGNHIGHQTVIEDNVFISSHVVVSGYCEVGANSFMGVNSSVANDVRIAPDNIIAMGAVIHKHTEPRRIYKGNPGKPDETKDSFAVMKVKEETETETAATGENANR